MKYPTRAPAKPSCSGCFFFDEGGAPLSSATRNPLASPGRGVCHVEPPVIVEQGGLAFGLWPEVAACRPACSLYEPLDPGGDDGDGERQPTPSNVISIDRSAA